MIHLKQKEVYSHETMETTGCPLIGNRHGGGNADVFPKRHPAKLYEEYRYLKKEYADLEKASQTIDDYLANLRDEPEHMRKKGELE